MPSRSAFPGSTGLLPLFWPSLSCSFPEPFRHCSITCEREGCNEHTSVSAGLHGRDRRAHVGSAGCDDRLFHCPLCLPDSDSDRASHHLPDGAGSQPVWRVEHLLRLAPAASPSPHWLPRGPPSLCDSADWIHHRHLAGLPGRHPAGIRLVPSDNRPLPFRRDLLFRGDCCLLPRLEALGWFLQRTLGDCLKRERAWKR